MSASPPPPAAAKAHTPGPWRWERVAEEQMVTEFTLKGPDVLCRYWHDKPASADALLIAAAPDLLDVICDFIEALDAGEVDVSSADIEYTDGDGTPHSFPWHEEWIAKMRAALARATAGGAG